MAKPREMTLNSSHSARLMTAYIWILMRLRCMRIEGFAAGLELHTRRLSPQELDHT